MTPRITKKLLVGVSAVLPALAVATAGAPYAAHGADHLDAPGLSSPSMRPDADITDIYAFRGSRADRTVLALNVGPAAGVIAPTTFAPDVDYVMNVDRNGDDVADLAYVVRFKPERHGRQEYHVLRYSGHDAESLVGGKVIATGWTGRAGRDVRGVRTFAGLRSDPFFFDLAAFESVVLGKPLGRSFCDAGTTDFFAPLNVDAIVLEVPSSALGEHIGYWATTRDASGQIDRMGRPAINTVFNQGNDKNEFNHGMPTTDYARFHQNVESTLATFSGLDSEGAYTAAEVNGLTHVLLPDVLTYAPGTQAAGPLNGRGLTDDVIDAELNIVTGGYPFAGRDGKGAITTDCVGAHTDLLTEFPYEGNPHS